MTSDQRCPIQRTWNDRNWSASDLQICSLFPLLILIPPLKRITVNTDLVLLYDGTISLLLMKGNQTTVYLSSPRVNASIPIGRCAFGSGQWAGGAHSSERFIGVALGASASEETLNLPSAELAHSFISWQLKKTQNASPGVCAVCSCVIHGTLTTWPPLSHRLDFWRWVEFFIPRAFCGWLVTDSGCIKWSIFEKNKL